MSRTRNSETTVDKQGEDVEKFATKVFRWVRQVNHHAKRGGTLLPVDVQVAVELSQYFTGSDQGGRAFPSSAASARRPSAAGATSGLRRGRSTGAGPMDI